VASGTIRSLVASGASDAASAPSRISVNDQPPLARPARPNLIKIKIGATKTIVAPPPDKSLKRLGANQYY